MKLIKITHFIFIILALSMVSCVPTGSNQTTAGNVVKGGKIVIGTPQEPKILNPLLTTSSVESLIYSFVVEGLVQIGSDGNYIPVLTEGLPAVSSDGLVVTYTLKKTRIWEKPKN